MNRSEKNKFAGKIPRRKNADSNRAVSQPDVDELDKTRNLYPEDALLEDTAGTDQDDKDRQA